MKLGVIASVIQTVERIGPAARILLQSAQHRGELAAMEAAEARDHMVVTLAAAGGALAAVTMFGFSFTFTVAALVWHRDDRALFLGGLTLLYLVGAVLIGLWIKKRVTSWAPLVETRNQLRADCASLQAMLPDNEDDEAP